MSLELTHPIVLSPISTVQRSIIEALAYSDIFDYPLRMDELHRYLPLRIDRKDLVQELENHDNRIEIQDGFYYLAGRKDLLATRRTRNAASAHLFSRAFLYGRILGALPFIRMVALTGSLALLNCDKSADIDYMLVASNGRIWLARAFAIAFGRLTRSVGNTICPNLIVSDRLLQWSLHDLYSAREICQMVPFSGFDVYARLRQANSWTDSFLPNASVSAYPVVGTSDADTKRKIVGHPNIFASPLEWTLSGALGKGLEAWEMKRKVYRFSHQLGYGAETVFNADICQGNFNHHAAQTREAFETRLRNLSLEPASHWDCPGVSSFSITGGEFR